MDEVDFIVIAMQYAAYTCTVATILLRLLPTPEETVSIFILTVPPRQYQIFYNLLRWISGNKSWIVRKTNGE